MSLKLAVRIAGMVLLAAALAGCIDAHVDIEVTSETTATATMTQTMGAEFYSMVKMNQEQAGTDAPEEDEFCAKGALTENADGTATCIITEDGNFADLTMGNDKETVRFSPAGPGLVRVSLPTAEMKSEIGADATMDTETKQMIEAFFKDHAVTVRFGGVEVLETNMELAADKASAEQEIPFLDLINGTADLPDELFAVVRVR